MTTDTATLPSAPARSDASEVYTLIDIELPNDGYEDVPMTGDLTYPCRDQNRALPLILVLPGGGGRKEFFSTFCGELAQRGYATLTLSQLRKLPNVPPAVVLHGNPDELNNMRPQIVRQALDWAASEQGRGMVPPLNLNSVFVVGHSSGAAMAVAAVSQQVLPKPTSHYANDGTSDQARHAPLHAVPEIRGMFLFGYTLWDRLAQPPDWSHGVSSARVPTMVVNGSHDICSATCGGTLERLQAPTVGATLRGFDHFSIADKTWLLRAHEQPSTVPRAQQVHVVASLAHAWFAFLDSSVASDAYAHDDAQAERMHRLGTLMALTKEHAEEEHFNLANWPSANCKGCEPGTAVERSR